jgi:hypothetical protein
MKCRCPRFSADGKRLAYVGDNRIYIAEMESGGCAPRTGGELRVDEFLWT